MLRVLVAFLLCATISASLTAGWGTECRASTACAYGELCIRGRCTSVLKKLSEEHKALGGKIPASCLKQTWPNVTNCVNWSITEKYRVCESNNVPDYYVAPYCPFGAGQGYCQSPTQGNSTDCPPFAGKTCPCVPSVAGATAGPGPASSCPAGTTSVGDVMVNSHQIFKFPLNPDPTDSSKPKHMYADTALTNGNTYQVIGAHLNGVQLKGPAEANGFNVDTSLIPLNCGGHVTPPVGPGPVYHYHKAADCLKIETMGSHGPLIGYASDGFGIYGYGDYDGAPMLDECHGHFGKTPDAGFTYHYHAAGVFNLPNTPHRPYYLGCQGPSKGKCNSTVSPDYDGGANWCGQGCGADLCLQPGSSKTDLIKYLDQFTSGNGAAWLANFTINS